MLKPGEALPASLLARPVVGVGLSPGTLRDQLRADPTLLVFLRHFGCIFCRETLVDMRAFAECEPRFPDPLFFYQGSPSEGRAFLRRYWPGLRAVADPKAEIYEAMGIGRGSLLQMFGPSVWSARSKAQAKGHQNGERQGDVWRMPGVFLVSKTELLWSHEYRHAADHPDYEEICRVAAAAVGPAT